MIGAHHVEGVGSMPGPPEEKGGPTHVPLQSPPSHSHASFMHAVSHTPLLRSVEGWQGSPHASATRGAAPFRLLLQPKVKPLSVLDESELKVTSI